MRCQDCNFDLPDDPYYVVDLHLHNQKYIAKIFKSEEGLKYCSKLASKDEVITEAEHWARNIGRDLHFNYLF